MKHETSSHTIKRARIKLEDDPVILARFTMLVAEHGARFGEITTVHIGNDHKVRDADIIAPSEVVFDQICDSIRRMDGIDLLEVKDVVHEAHLNGKIEIAPRVAVKSIDDLQLVYTPGVAAVCRQIEANPSLAYELTGIQNSVAIVTNGTAILGLGDVGPVAGMPVMEAVSAVGRYQRLPDPGRQQGAGGDHPHRRRDRQDFRSDQVGGHSGAGVLRGRDSPR
jgi:malate dehydrogenase (oxaloacetate-decarboxylating)